MSKLGSNLYAGPGNITASRRRVRIRDKRWRPFRAFPAGREGPAFSRSCRFCGSKTGVVKTEQNPMDLRGSNAGIDLDITPWFFRSCRLVGQNWRKGMKSRRDRSWLYMLYHWRAEKKPNHGSLGDEFFGERILKDTDYGASIKNLCRPSLQRARHTGREGRRGRSRRQKLGQGCCCRWSSLQ